MSNEKMKKKKKCKINTIYQHVFFENNIYKHWETNFFFKPHAKFSKENFCIMLPPPNVTGTLHMGHAFQQTIMDIIIRYQRMQGKNTLWQYGTDHAGIGTQMIVERKIEKKNKNRYDYGREELIKKIWNWKEKSGNKISSQMRRLGNSVDWDRERFTLDKNFSRAVKKVFFILYKKNIIYRSKNLVNWDPNISTAISDLEIENIEYKGYMWYLRYPLAENVKTIEGKNYLIIATTRPETILGDTCIAVNKKDPRYNHLIGKKIILPIVGRYISIISDEYADIKKGTGCVKITPAHDFHDYEVAQRNSLPIINIMTYSCKIREKAEVFNSIGKKCKEYCSKIPINFIGLNRFSVRKEILSSLNELGLLDSIKYHTMILHYGDRSGVVLEPMLTNQWYVRTAPLVKIAIQSVKKIIFFPKKYEKIYLIWMRKIKDWCISRQLWWGHRIPAWYDMKGKVYVGYTEYELRKKHNIGIDIYLNQDQDVLDTWFSSSIWTFSTLGWPDNTESMKIFHPTNVVVSGFDIIFFWISRMIMLTMHFIKDENGNPQVPFNKVYITGLICDEEGKKMSKSKGNIIDPLDIVDGISLKKLLEKRTRNMMQPQLSYKIIQKTEKIFPNGIDIHSIDSLRFTLTALSYTNRYISWEMKRIKGYRNFCNKLWNASRFILINTENKDCGFHGGEISISLADIGILVKLNHTVKNYRTAIDTYRFDIAAKIIYKFIWNQLCDWYIEIIKPCIFYNNRKELRGTLNTMITVLESLLRLTHPIIPFLTETIWQYIKQRKGITGNTIMLQPFPNYNEPVLEYKKSVNDLNWIKKYILTVRHIRANMNINKKIKLLLLRNINYLTYLLIKENKIWIKNLGNINCIIFLHIEDTGPVSFRKLIEGCECCIPMHGFFNKNIESARLNKEIYKINNYILSIQLKLRKTMFLSRALESIGVKENHRIFLLKEDKKKIKNQINIMNFL